MTIECPICLEYTLNHSSSNKILDLECYCFDKVQIKEGADAVTFQYFRHLSNKRGLKAGDYLSNESVRNIGVNKAPERLGGKGSRKRANVSAWIYHQHGRELSFEEIYKLGPVKLPSVTEQILLLLKEFERDSESCLTYGHEIK